MNRYPALPSRARRCGLTTTAAALSVLAGSAAANDIVRILPLGDSLVYGQGSASPFNNNLGFRLPLQQWMWDNGTNYDMTGGLTAGSFSGFDPTPNVSTTYTGAFGTLTDPFGNTRPIDLDHFGWPGAQAGSDSDGVTSSRTLLSALTLNNQEETLEFSNGNGAPYTSGWQDVNVYGGLIQQHGTDFYAGPNPGTPWTAADVAATSNPNADLSWIEPMPPDVVLLHAGTNNINTSTSSGENALDEFEDLLVQLQADWNAGKMAADVELIIANIIPKLANSSGDPTINLTTIDESFEFNAGLEAILDATDGGTPIFDLAFKDRVTFVDMFAVPATTDLANTIGSDVATLDPNGDGFVDWITGTYNPTNGLGTKAGANTDLWGPTEFIHPVQLGYDVMAYQFYTAMDALGVLDTGQLIPEPASVALLIGGLTLGLRRRQPTSTPSR